MARARGRQTAKSPPPEAVESETANPLAHIAEQLRGLAVDAATLQLHPRNARKHGDEDLAAIAGSLQRFGQRTPLVVQRVDGVILKGNGTYRAGTELLGWSQLAVVFVDDDATTASGYALADNRTAELSEWDDQLLAEQIAAMQIHDEDFAELQLDDFLPADDTAAVDIPQVYGVTVDAGSEALQREVYERLIEAFPVLAKDGKIKLQTM